MLWYVYFYWVKYLWCVVVCGIVCSSNYGFSGFLVGSFGVDEYIVGNGGEFFGFFGIVDYGRNCFCR